jgi:hypothetical protein
MQQKKIQTIRFNCFTWSLLENLLLIELGTSALKWQLKDMTRAAPTRVLNCLDFATDCSKSRM